MFEPSTTKRDSAVRSGGSVTLLMVALVVVGLYFGRVIFIPLALALLLAFLLAPLVSRVRRWGLGRISSVVAVVLLAFSLLATIGGVMGMQMADLAQKLPGYQKNFHQKLQSIQTSGSGLMRRAANAVRDFKDALNLEPTPTASSKPGQQQPVPVEIHAPAFSPLEFIRRLLSSVASILLVAALVIVFVIFMLVQQEDLRDRLIRLGGAERVWTTTRVLNDATRRVSRYLLAQVIVNATYGLLVGVSLYLLGVPNPLLWGLTATLLRYVPYLGIWIAAAMAALVAFAVEPGWIMLPIIFGLYAGIDMILYNFVEPLLYGTSTGVSPFAILVAAVFWTWLWGPVGLLLSTPLTVCLVVIGRHVPRLEFLSLMMSDGKVLRPQFRLYQRLVASDLEDAAKIAKACLKTRTREEFYDTIVVPALIMAGEDQAQGRIPEGRVHLFWENVRSFMETSAAGAGKSNRDQEVGSKTLNAGVATGGAAPRESAEAVTVLCLPAGSEADEVAALMLQQLLKARGIGANSLPLSADPLEEWPTDRAGLFCVCTVPPLDGLNAVDENEVCRRLRLHRPEVKLLLVVLTEELAAEPPGRPRRPQADQVVPSFQRAVSAIVSSAGLKGRPAPPRTVR